jgi:hypothetical protein
MGTGRTRDHMAGGSISQARSWLDATLNRFLMMLDSWSGGAQSLPRRVSGPARIDGLPFPCSPR